MAPLKPARRIALRDLIQIDLTTERLVAAVHLQDRHATFFIRQVDGDPHGRTVPDASTPIEDVHWFVAAPQ